MSRKPLHQVCRTLATREKSDDRITGVGVGRFRFGLATVGIIDRDKTCCTCSSDSED